MLFTQKSFADRRFYTQTLLHTDTLYADIFFFQALLEAFPQKLFAETLHTDVSCERVATETDIPCTHGGRRERHPTPRSQPSPS